MLRCKSLEDVKNVYGEDNIIKIVNIKQIILYAKMQCQPVWIDEGYSGKLVAYYVRSETDMAWEYWKRSDPNRNGPDKQPLLKMLVIPPPLIRLGKRM